MPATNYRPPDQRSKEALRWRKWYTLPIWKRRRAKQLADEPLCRICKSKGIVKEANTADHDPPHRGNWEQFIYGPLRSLCEHCHNSIAQSEEKRGYSLQVGEDGWPTDPRHPANR